MDIFSLVATLGLDSLPFISGINSAQQLFSSFASAVVGFASDVMQTGLGFDQAMANVASVLGEQEGNIETMNRLRAYAREEARDSIFTAEEAAQAYYYMGMAGWKSQQMMAGLPGIMDLAAASGESLANVSDIVTDSLTAFGLTADDTQRYVDILAQTATNANTNVGLMGETFQYVAPLAGTLGADVDDVAWTIGLMADAGVKGSMAGTALRNIFSRISTNAGATSKSLGALDIITKELGVSFRDSEGRMRDWGDAILDVRDKWKELGDEQQIEYAKQIATERGMAGWLVLMGRSADEVAALGVALDGATDAAQTMANTRLDSLAGDVTLFNSALYDLKLAIYEDVKGPLRDVVQWGTDAINDITKAIDENGLAGGIEVLGDKIEEAGEKFAPLLESIGKAAGPLVDALLDSIIPRMVEVGSKLGEGLLVALGNSMAENSSSTGGLVGTIISTIGNGFKITEALGGVLKRAGEEGGKSSAEAWMEGMLGIPQYEIDAIDAKAMEWGKKWGTTSGDNMAENIGTEIGNDAPTMRDDLADVLGAAGTPAGQTIANDIGTELSSRTYSINVQANVSGLPTQRNASAMTAGRIFTRATVFGFANGRYQVAGDAGPEAVIGTNSLAQLIQSAVRGVMGGNTFTVPRANPAPRNIVIPLYIDGVEFARTEVPYIEAEQQRVGLKLTPR